MLFRSTTRGNFVQKVSPGTPSKNLKNSYYIKVLGVQNPFSKGFWPPEAVLLQTTIYRSNVPSRDVVGMGETAPVLGASTARK